MTFFKTIAVAFSMYSKLPMPRVEWTRENMRYAMCAFPFIGIVTGLLVFLWDYIARLLSFGPVLVGAGITLLPVLVCGGIHLDGFCDTADALSSHAPREKKLEILKDSHSGAFAILAAVCYFLLFFALSTELERTVPALFCLSLSFLLSRTLSGLSVASFSCAKNSGLVYAFADASAKKQVRVFLLVLAAVLCAALLCVSWFSALFMIAAAGLTFLYYFIMSKRSFGGITGDLAGFFLVLCELFMLAGLVLSQKLCLF